ncbi:hypothetical protein ACROYT_G013834 [Oculina patagonica]
MPSRCQENASFIIDLDALDSREDIYCVDKSIWLPTGCKSKLLTIERGAVNKVCNLVKGHNNYYKNSSSSSSGCNSEVVAWCQRETSRLNLKEKDLWGGLIFDEMTIQLLRWKTFSSRLQ